MTRLRLATLLIGLIPLSGCFDETLELTLLPDGSGRLSFEMRLGKRLAKLHTFTQDMHESSLHRLDPNEEPPLSPNENLLGEVLLDFHGVDGWSDLTVGENEKGELVLRADGWFEDVNAVTRGRDYLKGSTLGLGSRLGFVLGEDHAGNRTLEARHRPGAEDLEDVDATVERLTRFRSEAPSMTQTVVLQLPAAPTQTSNFAADGPNPGRVAVRYGAADVDEYLLRYAPAARKLWAQVQSGKLSHEKALELLERVMNMPRSIVTFPKLRDDPSLRAEHAAALSAWEASPWKRSLVRVRETLAGEAVGLDPNERPGPFPAGLVEGEEFALELQPNGAAQVALTVRFDRTDPPGAFEDVGPESDELTRSRACVTWLGASIEGLAFESWTLAVTEDQLILTATGYSSPNSAIVHRYEDERSVDRRALTLISSWNARARNVVLSIVASAGEGAPPVSVRVTPPARAQGTVGFEEPEPGVLSWTLAEDGPPRVATGWSVGPKVEGTSLEFLRAKMAATRHYMRSVTDGAREDVRKHREGK